MPVAPKGSGSRSFDQFLEEQIPAAREERQKRDPNKALNAVPTFDNFLSGQSEDREQVASDLRARAVVEADPVQVNKEAGIASQLDVPRSVVQADPEAAAKDLRAERLIERKKALRKTNPRMAILMEDSDFAEALQGPDGNAEPAQALSDLSLLEGLGNNWELSSLGMDVAELRHIEMMNVLGFGDPLTEIQQAELRRLKGQVGRMQRYESDSTAAFIALSAAELGPSVLNVMGESIEWGAKGFGTGLGIGAVAGLAGGPSAPVSVPAVALSTGTWLGVKGLMFGGVKGGVEAESGSAYDRYLEEGIPARTAAEAALLYGLVAGGVEALSLGILGRVFIPGKKALIGKAAQRLVSRQFGEKLVRRTMANAAAKVAEASATNYAQEASQSALEDVIGQQAYIKSIGPDAASGGTFPTRHPFVTNPDGSGSNVLLMTRGYGGREFVIPTMVEGEILTPEAAAAVAERVGLEKYPSFPNLELAQKWIDQNHAKIAEDGSWGDAPWIPPETFDRAHEAGLVGLAGGFAFAGVGSTVSTSAKLATQERLSEELNQYDQTADLLEQHGVDAQILQQSAAVSLEGQAPLYVNARALVASATQEPALLREVIDQVPGMDSESVAEAAEAGHDIPISKADYLLHVAGKKNGIRSELLRPLIKVDPTVESDAELAQVADSIQADTEATVLAAEEDQARIEEFKVERQRLESATYEMLRQTGRYNDSDARKLSKLMPAISIMAERAGVDMSSGVGAPVVMGPGGRGAGLAQGPVGSKYNDLPTEQRQAINHLRRDLGSDPLLSRIEEAEVRAFEDATEGGDRSLIPAVSALQSSETIASLLSGDTEKFYGWASQGVPFDFDFDIQFSQEEFDSAANKIRAATQEALLVRGMPDEFLVYRSGNLPSGTAVGVSLDYMGARGFAFESKREEPGTVKVFRVKRSDVGADMESLFSGGLTRGENELLIDSEILRDKQVDEVDAKAREYTDAPNVLAQGAVSTRAESFLDALHDREIVQIDGLVGPVMRVGEGPTDFVKLSLHAGRDFTKETPQSRIDEYTASRPDDVSLSAMQTLMQEDRKKGLGTKALTTLMSVADEFGVRIVGHPDNKLVGTKRTPQKKLEAWYRKHGLKPYAEHRLDGETREQMEERIGPDTKSWVYIPEGYSPTDTDAPNVLMQGAAPSFKSTGLKVVSGQTDVRVLDELPKPELAKRRADLKRRILNLSPEAKAKYGLRTLTEAVDDKTMHDVAKNLAAIFHNMKLADKKELPAEEKRLSAATNRALKKRTIAEIAEYFDSRYRGNRIDHRDATRRQIKMLEDRMFEEAMHAIQLHPEAMGWYRENVALAMSVLEEFDPDITQPENLLVFQLILAISSNGNDTGPNFNMSMKEYLNWKKTGEIDGKAIHGKEVSTIRATLSIAKEMLDAVGHEKLLEFLSRKGNAAELKAALIETFGLTERTAHSFATKTGEVVSAVVPFSVIFGPKLGSFFNNLNGDYSTTTFDLWFMRWIGRQTGTYLQEVTEAEKAKRANRFVTAAKAVPAAYRKKLGIELSQLKGEGVIKAGKAARRHYTVEDNRKNLTKAQDELRKAANGLFKSDRVDTPEGGEHRQWMRARMDAVIQRLKEAGVEIEPADLQAVLWYLEKELYYAFGQQKKSDADDYASAAEATYVELAGRPSSAYASGTGQVGTVGRLGPDAQGAEAGVSGQEVQQEGLASAFDPDPSSRTLMQGPANQLGLYTPLGRTLSNAQARKQTPQQIRKLLEKARVKKDEILWTGLDEYLEGLDPNKSIKLDEVLEVLNFVRLDETTLVSQGIIESETADFRKLAATVLPPEELVIIEYPVEEAKKALSSARRTEREREGIESLDDEDIFYGIQETRKGLGNTDMDAPVYHVGFMRDGEFVHARIITSGPLLENPANERHEAIKEEVWSEAVDSVQDGRATSHLENEIENRVMIARGEDERVNRVPTLSNPFRGNRTTRHDHLTEPGGESYQETLIRLPDTVGTWESPHEHFGGMGRISQNILVHVRWNERQGANGERVLFIEEVQDDWTKEGRKKGYIRPSFKTRNRVSGNFGESFNTREDAEAYVGALPESIRSDVDIIEGSSGQVHDRPFKKTSHELALKRMLVIAAKEGFDAVAWTPGYMQVDRWSTQIRRSVDSIKYRRKTAFEVYEVFPDGRRELYDSFATRKTAYSLAADDDALEVVEPTSIIVTPVNEDGWQVFWLEVDPDTGLIIDTDNNVDLPPNTHLSSVVGNQMAKQILEDEATEGKIEGENLTIGGKGFEDVYDVELVNAANKIGKQFGAQVSDEPATFAPNRAEVEKAGAFYEQNMEIREEDGAGFQLMDEDGYEIGWFPALNRRRTLSREEQQELASLEEKYRSVPSPERHQRADFVPIIERLKELKQKKSTLDLEYLEDRSQAEEKAIAAKDEYIAQKVRESGVLPFETRDVHTLPITPELRASAVEDGLPLFQAQDTGPRGMIEFLDDGQAIIKLLESADVTTFIHESGHLYLEHMARLVDAGASNEFVEDWRTVLDWFGRNAKTVSKWAKANEADLVNRFGQTAFNEAMAGGVKMIQALAAQGDIRVGSGSQGVLAVAMQEIWAETFEGYIATGKAPSLRLKKAFQAFTRWMMQIYGAIRNEQLLTDDITEVMDRMIATDEEMAAARKDLMLTETPGLALEGRSKEQLLDALEQAKAEALEETNQRILAKERRAQSKRWKENRKTILEEVRKDLREEPAYQADHWLRTGQWIDPENEPEGLPPAEKLSLTALKRLYGQETVDALLGGRTGHYQRKGGLEPGAVVMNLRLNMESGDELIAELVALVPFEEAAAQEADRRMIEKYGRPDDLLRESTEEIIHSVESQELALKLEMKQLATLRSAMRRPARVQIATEGIRTAAQMAEEITAAEDELLMARAENEMRKLNGQEPNDTRMREATLGLEAARVRASEAKDQREVQSILKRKALAIEQTASKLNAKLKEVARRKIDITPSAMIRPDLFRTAEQKAAREERKALREGDYDAADNAMRRRVYNFHAYRMALQARSEEQRHVKYLKNFLKKSWIKRINDARGEHSKLIYGLLDQFDLRISVSGKSALASGDLRKSLEDMSQRGEFAHVASYLMGEEQEDGTFGEPLRKHYKAMTPGELKDLRDAVESLYHHSKKDLEELQAEKQARTERVLSGMLEIQSRSKRKRDPDAIEANTPLSARVIRRLQDRKAGRKDKEKTHREGLRHQIHASLTKPEFLFTWMDGNTNMGFAWTTFYKPFADASNKAAERLDQLNKKLEKIYKAHYKRSDMARWRHLWHQSVEIDIGGKYPERFTKEKLIALGLHAGNKLNRDAVTDSLGWDESVYDFVLSHLDKNDWSFIQSVWDLIESQWPESAKLHKEMTGVTPQKEAATEVFTQYGTLRGGYYPIAWDRDSDPKIAAAMEEKEVAGIFGGAWSSAMTDIGHLHARKEHSGLGDRQLNLSLSVIDNHLKQTTHDIFFRKPIVEVNGYLKNKQIGKALTTAIGQEHVRALSEWIVAIASNKSTETTMDKWTEWGAKKIRVGYTSAMIGLKLSTALIQPTGYLITIKQLGERYALKGLWDYYGRFKLGPKEKADNIKNMSEFVWANSSFMRSRHMNFDKDIGQARSSLTSRSMLKEVDEAAFWMVGFVQQGVDMPTWLGAYSKAMDGKVDGIGIQDHESAVDFADSTVRLGQSHGGVVDLAKIQRGTEVFQLFNQFYSFWSAFYGNMAGELGWTNFDRDVKRPRQIANLFYMLFLMPYLEEAIRSGDFGQDDDDDSNPIIWYLKMPLVTASNMVPGVRSLVQGIDSGWMRSPTPLGNVVETGMDIWQQTKQAAQGEGIDRPMYKAYMDGFGIATRLPTPALMKYSEALYYYAQRDDITFHDMAFGVPKEKRSTDY